MRGGKGGLLDSVECGDSMMWRWGEVQRRGRELLLNPTCPTLLSHYSHPHPSISPHSVQSAATSTLFSSSPPPFSHPCFLHLVSVLLHTPSLYSRSLLGRPASLHLASVPSLLVFLQPPLSFPQCSFLTCVIA